VTSVILAIVGTLTAILAAVFGGWKLRGSEESKKNSQRQAELDEAWRARDEKTKKLFDEYDSIADIVERLNRKASYILSEYGESDSASAIIGSDEHRKGNE
jgi:hypothetical protein